VKIKKIFLTLTITLLFIFSGCENNTIIKQQKEQINISLSWWGNDERNEYTIEAVKKFEELHPDIKVKCSYSEWSGYQARNKVQMVSNTESDVMQINYAWLEQYSPDGNGYYDMNTLSDYIDLSNFSETEIAYGIKNGKLNALPIALNTEAIYINKSIYNDYGLDIPKTWDDIFHAAEVMNGKNYPITMNSKSALFYTTAYTEERTGKKFINDDGTLGFNSDDIAIMLDFYCQLINKNVMPQVEYFDKLAIETGEYAGVIAWLSDASKYMDSAIDNGFEIIVADYPSYNQKISWYIKPATMYAISCNTEYPEESAMLLDFLLNSNEMAELQGIEKGIPLSQSARKYLVENDRLNGIQYEAFLKMNEFSNQLTLISPYMENGNLLDNFSQACNDVLYEKKELNEASEELYITFCNILDKYQN
jgi:oligogalacturonide transport system substrate-binding protein